jgi:hypothetical protein
MFEWLRRGETPPPAPITEPLPPMQQYAQEFMAASEWTAQQGLFVPPVQLVVNKDCVDWTEMAPVMQRLIGPYRDEEIAKELFAMNTRLVPQLYEAVGIPFRLTIGWFDISGAIHYQHDQALLKKLLQKDASVDTSRGLGLHVWLTSPAFEIIDVCLPTIMALRTNQPEKARGIFYASNQDPHPSITYRPTAVGEEFLFRIGAIFGIGPNA